MSIIGGIGRKLEKLPNRFAEGGGWVDMGVVEHAPRTNSVQEIMDSITLAIGDYEKKRNIPENEVINFLKTHFDIDVVEKAKNAKTEILEFVKSLGQRDLVDKTDGRTKTVDFGKLYQWAVEQKEIRKLDLEGLKTFVANMKGMPQRHLGLAQDIIDLTNFHAFIDPEIFPTANLHVIGKTSNGERQSFLQYIFSSLPRISRETPEALNLAEKVMTHSDDANGKFFISRFFKFIPSFPQMRKQMAETEEFVPEFAKETLKGMPSMSLDSYCKENKFFSKIMTLCESKAKAENIKIFKEANKLDKKYKVECDFNLNEIATADTRTMQENIEVLPSLLENADAQGINNIDVSGFLAHNVNLK